MRAREQAGIGDGFFDKAEALVAVDHMLAAGVHEAERLAVELHFAVKLASQPAPDVAGCWGATLPLSPCIRRKLADSMDIADRGQTWGEWRLTRSYPRGEHVQHDPEADLAWPRDDTPLDRRPAWLRGDLKHAEQRREARRSRYAGSHARRFEAGPDRRPLERLSSWSGSGAALLESTTSSTEALRRDAVARGVAAYPSRVELDSAIANLRESFIAVWDQRDQLEAMRAQLQRSEAWTTATRGLASCTVALDHERRSPCTIVMVALQTSNGTRRMGETRIPDRAIAHRSTTVAAEAIALVERVADEARRRVQGPGPEQARP